MIKEFENYLEKMTNIDQREKFEEVLKWVMKKYPKLEQKYGWNVPMFMDHGTFIIAFATAKDHFSVNVEILTKDKFEAEIKEAGYDCTKGLFKIKYSQDVDYKLLAKLIEFNIKDKADCKTFWR